jgi:hypothetical protein
VAALLLKLLAVPAPCVLTMGRTDWYLWGERWHVSGMRLPKGEYLIVVSERECERAIADYARRWEVETLFGCLKRRGFCLEQTHVTDPARLKKLLGLLGHWSSAGRTSRASG